MEGDDACVPEACKGLKRQLYFGIPKEDDASGFYALQILRFFLTILKWIPFIAQKSKIRRDSSRQNDKLFCNHVINSYLRIIQITKVAARPSVASEDPVAHVSCIICDPQNNPNMS